MITTILNEIKLISKAVDTSEKYSIQILTILALIPPVFIRFLRSEILNNNSLYSRYNSILEPQLISSLRVVTLSVASGLFLVTLLFISSFIIRLLLDIEFNFEKENLRKTIGNHLSKLIVAIVSLTILRSLIIYLS